MPESDLKSSSSVPIIGSARRYDTLEALRGLAAFSVVIHHVADSMPQSTRETLSILYNGPLRLFISGRPAVMIFFVISGFVLSLSMETGITYRNFLIRRFCRIYLPYTAAILISASLLYEIGYSQVTWLGEWFNVAIWSVPLSPSLILSHLDMRGRFIDANLDPVIWTLIYELRISILFPLLFLWLEGRSFLFIAVAGACLFAVCDIALNLLDHNTRQLNYSETVIGSILTTGHFVFPFLIGMAIAIHRIKINILFVKLRSDFGNRLNISLAATLIFCFFAVPLLGDLALIVASAIIIAVIALMPELWNNILSLPILRYLGKVSYSLYLFHMVIFAVLVHAWPYAPPPMWSLWIAIPLLSIFFASITYYVIEAPTMRLGRYLTANRKFGK